MTNEYLGHDNSGKPRIDYVNRLRAMKDYELEKEAERKIWLSAYANNNLNSDYHWHATACYDVARERGKPELYAKAFEAAKASCS